VYKDVFDRAQHDLGIQVVYAVTDTSNLPSYWKGATGRITPELIYQKVPDYQDCLFYISGPKGMVDSFKESLARMNVPASQVKTDYFSGLS
jgi:ferredoxin-NADP reductase